MLRTYSSEFLICRNSFGTPILMLSENALSYFFSCSPCFEIIFFFTNKKTCTKLATLGIKDMVNLL